MSSGIANGAVSTIPPNAPVYVFFDTTGTLATYYTVPTGKTFYAQGMLVNCKSTGTANLYVDATTLFQFEMAEYQTQTFTGNPVFTMTAGQALKAQDGSPGDFSIAVWGYLL